MPQTKFQDFVFTLIMVCFMVYGMVTYNAVVNTGTIELSTFVSSFREIAVMAPIAFILEFFVVGKIAPRLAFSVMRPTDRPQFITYAISICIVCIMCPTMSLIGTLIFSGVTLETWFPLWIKTWVMNFPMALCYQLFFCGPIVRLIFRTIFGLNKKKATEGEGAHHGAAVACHGEAHPVQDIA